MMEGMQRSQSPANSGSLVSWTIFCFLAKKSSTWRSYWYYSTLLLKYDVQALRWGSHGMIPGTTTALSWVWPMASTTSHLPPVATVYVPSVSPVLSRFMFYRCTCYSSTVHNSTIRGMILWYGGFARSVGEERKDHIDATQQDPKFSKQDSTATVLYSRVPRTTSYSYLQSIVCWCFVRTVRRPDACEPITSTLSMIPHMTYPPVVVHKIPLFTSKAIDKGMLCSKNLFKKSSLHSLFFQHLLHHLSKIWICFCRLVNYNHCKAICKNELSNSATKWHWKLLQQS